MNARSAFAGYLFDVLVVVECRVVVRGCSRFFFVYGGTRGLHVWILYIQHQQDFVSKFCLLGFDLEVCPCLPL